MEREKQFERQIFSTTKNQRNRKKETIRNVNETKTNKLTKYP